MKKSLNFVFTIGIFGIFFLYSCSENIVPEDFNIRFRLSFTDEINTAKSIYKRNTINGDTSFTFILTPAERKEIYDVLVENDFETLPYSFEVKPNSCIQPHHCDALLISSNGTERRIDYCFSCETIRTDLEEKYEKIREKLMEVIKRRQKEIDLLPESGMFTL